MVIVVGGEVQKKASHNWSTLLKNYPAYTETAKKFLETSCKKIESTGSLYVHQKELAVVIPSDRNVSSVGSDGATTCIIAVLKHSGCGAVALAHLDGSGTRDCVIRMIEHIQELATGLPDDEIELNLVGGFPDKNGSYTLFHDIVDAFHEQPKKIVLRLVCVGEANIIKKNGVNFPAVYGVVVDVGTGELFPATFLYKGPDGDLRVARTIIGDEGVMEIYHSSTRLLKITPFNYYPFFNVDDYLEKSDEAILNSLSSSPTIEPTYFVPQLRAALNWIKNYSSSGATVFKDNQPRCYQRDHISGKWILTEE